MNTEDQIIYDQYRKANGLDCAEDVGRAYYLKKCLSKAKGKKSGYYDLTKKQLFVISNKNL